MDPDAKLKQIKLLINRLEHMSADSIWAHRASGIRGSLLDVLEVVEDQLSDPAREDWDNILDQGYYVLEQAAKLSITNNRIKVENSSNKSQ